MLDRYLRQIEKDGSFLAGYHKNHAEKAEKTYLSEHLRIIRILSGAGRWKIRDRVYDVGPGDLLLFNNVTPRQIIGVAAPPLVYELIGFSTQVFSLDPYYIKLFYSDSCGPVFPADVAAVEEVHRLLDLLRGRFQAEAPSSAVVAGLIQTVCRILFEADQPKGAEAPVAPMPSNTSCAMMERAIRYIEHNLCEIHDVSTLAASLHISRGYFHKLFTRYTGYTPKQFINHCRIVRFVHLITTRDLTVLDAAMQCGFESSSGFYKTFHSICGMSPTEYLQQRKNRAPSFCGISDHF